MFHERVYQPCLHNQARHTARPSVLRAKFYLAAGTCHHVATPRLVSVMHLLISLIIDEAATQENSPS